MYGANAKFTMYKLIQHSFWAFLLAWLLLTGCNHESFYSGSDYTLEFSTDTLAFDTVFSTIGSTTKYFLVRNTLGQPVKIESVRVPNAESFFRISVDGLKGNEVTDVEIGANDSLFVFVEITVDPTNLDNPLFIEDSVIFEMNGKQQNVKLHAYGQDVHLLKGAKIEEDTHWDGRKPYLVYDSLFVLPNATLSIAAGSTIYFHKDAFVAVFGSIEANGSVEAPITFRGDRLDKAFESYPYDKVAAQWQGIEIYPSNRVSHFNNCNIRNAVIGLLVYGLIADEPLPLILNNTVIHNNSYAGIFALYANITAKNCQITNSGNFNVVLTKGGRYNFFHCTMANYYGLDPGTKSSSNPGFLLGNAIELDQKPDGSDLEEANFYNCIIDGNLADEISLPYDESYQMNFLFDRCALKMSDSLLIKFPNNFKDCIVNEKVKFLKVERNNYDFSLDTLSTMRDQGRAELLAKHPDLIYDLIGNSRLTDGKPDLGAYEFTLEAKKED